MAESLGIGRHRPHESDVKRVLKDESSIAMHYFVQASREAPASVVAQGAVIARLCLESNDNPRTLKKRLLNDEAKIQQIFEIAETAHRVRGRNDVIVDDGHGRDIIEYGFIGAWSYLILEPEELLHISQTMYQNIMPYDTGNQEDNFGQVASEMIKAKWKQRIICAVNPFAKPELLDLPHFSKRYLDMI